MTLFSDPQIVLSGPCVTIIAPDLLSKAAEETFASGFSVWL